MWVDGATRAAWSDAPVARLPPERRATLTRRELDAAFYWETNYGSPLSYVRAVDVLAAAGLAELSGKRVVDFGYGTVGQLRLMATLGADAIGVDVNPLLPALYSGPADQGPVGRGHVTPSRGDGRPSAASAPRWAAGSTSSSRRTRSSAAMCTLRSR